MGTVSRHAGREAAFAERATAAGYTSSSELKAVLDASPDIQILMSSDQTILFANAAFHATNPDEAGPLIGRPLAAVLMGRDARRAASRRIILESVRTALATAAVVRPPPFRYDIQKDLSRPAREAWWRLSASPCDLDGHAGLLLTVCEVTDAVTLGRDAAEDPALAEPVEAMLWSERRRLGQMFDQAADLMALVVGPDHVFELINPALMRAAGGAQLLGRSLRDIVRSERGRELVRRLDETRATGHSYVAHAQPFRMTADADEDRYLDLTLQPLTNEAGQVEAVFCRGRDVTEQVRAQAVQQFLREELAHRHGNMLAIVLALAEQSSAEAVSLDCFRTVFASRLSTLAAVNILLNRDGPEVSVENIFDAVAHPCRPRARMRGGGITAAPTAKAAITLSLIFHELLQLTGAETTPASRGPGIRAWRRDGLLHVVWTAPGLSDFDTDGEDFARRLIDHAVRYEFGGRWRGLRRKKGVAICFEFPLSHSAWARPGAVA